MKLQSLFHHHLALKPQVFITLSLLLMAVAGCSNTAFDNSISNSAALSKQMAKQVLSKVVADDYKVTRTRHYPLSTHAPIYVDGNNDLLVQQFSSALKHHFRSVSDGVSKPSAKPHTGFILKVEQLDQPRAIAASNANQNQTTSSEKSVTDLSNDKTAKPYTEKNAPRQFRVTVSDIDKGEAFDSINIQLRSPSMWRDADSAVLLDRALMSAAAKLAGKS